MSQRPNRIRRFLADERGEVPLDFLALTASVLLLGAMYIGTSSDPAQDPAPEFSEEVFVRKCAHMRVEAGTMELASLRGGPKLCK